jgi:hypothetical protein
LAGWLLANKGRYLSIFRTGQEIFIQAQRTGKESKATPTLQPELGQIAF